MWASGSASRSARNAGTAQSRSPRRRARTIPTCEGLPASEASNGAAGLFGSVARMGTASCTRGDQGRCGGVGATPCAHSIRRIRRSVHAPSPLLRSMIEPFAPRPAKRTPTSGRQRRSFQLPQTHETWVPPLHVGGTPRASGTCRGQGVRARQLTNSYTISTSPQRTRSPCARASGRRTRFLLTKTPLELLTSSMIHWPLMKVSRACWRETV